MRTPMQTWRGSRKSNSEQRLTLGLSPGEGDVTYMPDDSRGVQTCNAELRLRIMCTSSSACVELTAQAPPSAEAGTGR